MRRNHGGRKQVHGCRLRTQPRRPHQHPGLLVQRATQVKDRGPGTQRLTPVLAGQGLSAAKKCKVDAIESFRANGLDEGNLVAHLVQLALDVFLVEQHEGGRRQRRLRNGFLQLPAQKR